MDRTEKREFVAGLNAALSDTSMVVVTRNQGLTVAEATELQAPHAGRGGDLQSREEPADLARLGRDPIRRHQAAAHRTDRAGVVNRSGGVAKTAVEFARTNDKFVLIGGALGTQTLDADGVKALAELPSLDELRARLVGMISTPATRIGGCAAGTGRPARAGLRGLRQDGRRRPGGGRLSLSEGVGAWRRCAKA